MLNTDDVYEKNIKLPHGNTWNDFKTKRKVENQPFKFDLKQRISLSLAKILEIIRTSILLTFQKYLSKVFNGH